MTITTYKDDIHRDTNVLEPNVYLSNGQGCGTVWFATVEDARRILELWGHTPEGSETNLCKVCACSYAHGTKENQQFKEFMCREWKAQVASL